MQQQEEEKKQKCRRCYIPEINPEQKLCKLCSEAWEQTFIDSTLYNTNISQKQSYQHRKNLYYALFCHRKFFTNELHFQSEKQLNLMKDLYEKKHFLSSLDNEEATTFALQSKAAYGFLDVQSNDEVGTHIVSNGNIKKDSFLFHFSGDVEIFTFQNPIRIRLGVVQEERGNIAQFITLATNQQIQQVNVYTSLKYRSNKCYMCFYARKDLKEGDKLFVEHEERFGQVSKNHIKMVYLSDYI